jgi:antitoxin MazE
MSVEVQQSEQEVWDRVGPRPAVLSAAPLWLHRPGVITLWLLHLLRNNMKAKIIRIGNSQGIRIPKPLLEQSGLSGDVELHVRTDEIIIRPATAPRAGWAAAFKQMADEGDDAPLLDSTDTEWDQEEWEW